MSNNFSLSSGQVVNSSEQPSIRIAKNYYRLNAIGKFFTIFSLLAIVLSAIYLCFALTIVRVLPFSNMGFIPVKNSTVKGGLAPAGTIYYGNIKNTEGEGYIDHAKQAFIPDKNVVKVKVLDGPYGGFEWKNNNTLVIHGKDIHMNKNTHSSKYLNGEYIVQCLEGKCNRGDNFFISMKNIYGEPLEKVKEAVK